MEIMDHGWQSYDAWIAYFDLLGFKAMLRTLPLSILRQIVGQIVEDLHVEAREFEKNVECLYYADTFVFYSESERSKDYPGLLHVATHFMEKCIYKRVALRGAISFGEIAVSDDNRMLIGSAFLDGHQYGEGQDWLGLVLTPNAANRLKAANLDPARHGFVYGEIPRKKGTKANDEVYAYTFCRGVASFQCPLLHTLKEMQFLSPEETKRKYENTMAFIEKHWRMV